MLLQQHPEDITINSSVDAEGWESCTGATDEEEEEAVQWITYPILLIGLEDLWPPNATNATTNRRRESKGSRTICCSVIEGLQCKTNNNQPKERGETICKFDVLLEISIAN